jgi:hypothetical protein
MHDLLLASPPMDSLRRHSLNHETNSVRSDALMTVVALCLPIGTDQFGNGLAIVSTWPKAVEAKLIERWMKKSIQNSLMRR